MEQLPRVVACEYQAMAPQAPTAPSEPPLGHSHNPSSWILQIPGFFSPNLNCLIPPPLEEKRPRVL